MLKRHGLHVFLPTEIKWRRVTRHEKKPRVYPLLPRYLFVADANPWELMRQYNGRGLTGVLTLDGRRAAVASQREIDWLAAQSGGYVNTAQRVGKALEPGKLVQVTAGPYKDWTVKLESINGRTARILMHMFGGVREVEVPLAQLEAA